MTLNEPVFGKNRQVHDSCLRGQCCPGLLIQAFRIITALKNMIFGVVVE